MRKKASGISFTGILMILMTGAFFEDLIVLNVGLFYIRTYKLALLLSVLLILKKYRLKLPIPKISKLIFGVVLFLLLQVLSTFYSAHIPMSQKINYIFFNLSSVFLLIYLPLLLDEEREWISVQFIHFLKFFLYILVIYYVGQQFNISFFLQSDIRASDHLIGVFYERLFFCEFLIIISVILIVNNNIRGLFKYIFILLVSLIVVISDSATGMIGLLSYLLIIPGKFMKKILSIIIIISVSYFFIWPYIYQNVLTKAEKQRRELKIERKFGQNMEETNWRLLSSTLLVNNFISNPTILGHGFRDNAYFLKPYYWDPDSMGSSHTFFSILRDQGALGGLLFLYLFFTVFKKSWKLYLLNLKKQNKYLIVTLIFSYLFLLRLLFYYQTTFLWHYLIAVVLLDYYSRNKITRNEYINNNI